MTMRTLSPEERDGLETLARSALDANVLRRVQALLWLDDGEPVPAVATRLRVTRQAVYKWVARFQGQSTGNVAARLRPGSRSGRPRTVHGIIDPLILEVIDRDPRDLGYRSTVWTAPLLRQYLQEVHHLVVSRPSVSFAIDRLGLRWKRPRHDLARRATTWRQAKGGSNAAWRAGTAQSS
jgi:transposase